MGSDASRHPTYLALVHIKKKILTETPEVSQLAFYTFTLLVETKITASKKKKGLNRTEKANLDTK